MDPNKAYRITEFPEVEGIREAGKNVTTIDARPGVDRANDWRLAAFDNYAYSKDGSWYKLPQSVSSYEEENPFMFTDIIGDDIMSKRMGMKTGSAHGNRTQASLGKIWNGSTSTSGGLFPGGVLEIQGGNKVAYGVNNNRRLFKLSDWEDVPIGNRVGYKTGEMPLDNLTWYQRLPNGRYTMGEPVLPNKTIKYTTNLFPGYDDKMFWITDHYNYNSGKDINIKKSKRGTFTKAAKQHGMSVQSFANRVLRNPSKYSAAMRKKANFARNASKWNKQ